MIRLVRPSRRLLTAVLILILPVLLSHCTKKNPAGPTGMSLDDIAKLQAMHDPWPKHRSATAPEQLPPDRLEALGDLALKNRNFETSLVNYLQILKDHPERYDLRYKVGIIFLMSGKLEAAKKELAMVLVHRPQMLLAHEALGLVLLQQKQYTMAIDEFLYVLARDNQRPKTHYLLGITFLESGRPERAIKELKAASAMDRRSVSTLIALAQAYQQTKDYRQAVATLKLAQGLSPGNKRIYQLLGAALAAEKQYPQALEAYTRGGDEAQAYNNIGVHYFMEGQYEEAAKCFQRAIELRPTFYQEAKFNLQRALEKLQQARQDGS